MPRTYTSKSFKSKSNKSNKRKVVLQKETLSSSERPTSTFEENYHLHNKQKLIDALKLSGIHKLNKDKAHLFISNQNTPIRRQAAKDLIDNTHYVTLKETFNIIEKLIIKTYEDIDRYYNHLSKEERQNIKIYMYTGPNNKSFYFFACIAMYCIEKYNNKNKQAPLQIPIFVDKINTEFLVALENNTLILVDDVSYSGSQLAKMLDSYYNRICIIEGRRPPNIYAVLTALNEFSLNRLSEVTLTRTEKGTKLNQGPSPFKIFYLKEKLYKPLVKIIGIERYYYLNLFFNSWLSSDTNLAMYLDHKVADTTSTYKNVYVYGPIVPATYDLNFSYGNTMGDIYSFKYCSEEENDKLLKDFIKKNPSYTSKKGRAFNSEFTNIKTYLIHKANEEIIDSQSSPYFRQKVNDIITNKENKDTIQFIPFIETCNKSDQLKRIIEDKEIQEMDYIFFMADPEVKRTEIEELIELTSSKLEDVLRITTLLDNYRCPTHWYKDPSHPLRLI
jgi:hypothetical protein